MIRDIVKDQSVLSHKCEAATAEDSEIAQDLLDTMAANENCACLAANQIGVPKRIIAYYEQDEPRVMYNPRIVAGMRPYKVAEACLSLDEQHTVTRYYAIQVSYEAIVDGKLVTRKRRLQDWDAQVVQHAIDHCNSLLV